MEIISVLRKAAQKDDERSLCQSPRFQEAFDRAEEHFGEDGAFVASNLRNQERLKKISAALALTDLGRYFPSPVKSFQDIQCSEGSSSSSLPDFISSDGVHYVINATEKLTRKKSESLDTLMSHVPVVSFSENDADDESTGSATRCTSSSDLPYNVNDRKGIVVILSHRPPTPRHFSDAKNKSCQTDEVTQVQCKEAVENTVHRPFSRSKKRGLLWWFTFGCVRKSNPE